MKIWVNRCSEHSANLVMIGRFKDVTEPNKAVEIIERLKQQVTTKGQPDWNVTPDRYGPDMLQLLGDLNLATILPTELRQFYYDVDVKTNGNEVIITTDEDDVSAFLKVLFHQGARIEVYSAHDYPDTGYGRRRRAE